MQLTPHIPNTLSKASKLNLKQKLELDIYIYFYFFNYLQFKISYITFTI